MYKHLVKETEKAIRILIDAQPEWSETAIDILINAQIKCEDIFVESADSQDWIESFVEEDDEEPWLVIPGVNMDPDRYDKIIQFLEQCRANSEQKALANMEEE